MTPERWGRVIDVVERTLRVPAAERAALIAEVCGGDDELHGAVKAQLEALTGCPREFLATDGEATALNRPAPEIRIEGYSIDGELGRGGHSVVYRAVQRSVGRDVALKVSAWIPLDSERQRRRFDREAAAVGKLQHPGIVPVFDHGESNGAPWIAMELVLGHDLAADLRLSTDAGRILPERTDPDYVPRALNLVTGLARALQHAHEHHVVHRDVKPQNILLRPDGRAQLTDFGIAILVEDPQRTRTIGLQGTPHYMSPEQVGRLPDTVGPATDQYSLGVVLFELLTDTRPFGGEALPAILNAICNSSTPSVRDRDRRIPQDLDTITRTAMARDPSDRYESAGAFADDLERFLRLEAIHATRDRAIDRFRSWCRRRGRRIVAVGAAAALLVWFTMQVVAGQAEARQLAILDDGLTDLRTDLADVQAGTRNLEVLHSAVPKLEVIRRAIPPAAAALRARAGALAAELAAVVDATAARARAELRATLDRPQDGSRYTVPPIDTRLFLALTTLADASRIAPDLEPLARETELQRYFPTVSIQSDPPGATVVVRRVDWTTGEYDDGTVIGNTPVSGHPLPPGQYRIVVDHGDGGFAELARWVGEWRERYDLGIVRLRPTAAVAADMLAYEAGRHQFVLPDPALAEGEHRAFYLDRREVSNADYLEFMAASGSDAVPFGWSTHRSDPAWLLRPVVGISWNQARAYAEWRGKRLPTDLEWNRAAVGPYPADAIPGAESAVAGRYEESLAALTEAERITLYLSNVAPADAPSGDVSPRGVLHLLGNVAEWTETIPSNVVGRRRHPLITHRRVKGSSWHRRIRPTVLTYAEVPISQSLFAPTIGFRCAKSVQPLPPRNRPR